MSLIEDKITNKLYQLANHVLSKFVKPDLHFNHVTNLTEEILIQIKQQYKIEGIILDVDETIRSNMQFIPQCNQEWIDILKKHFKIIIVSNGLDGKIEDYFKQKQIDYIGFAHKPLKMNFKKACEKLNLQPENILVVGDSLFDDIYGGKRNNMKTVLIDSVEDELEK